jgi:dipeptidyl aminopeptidase/acylaminoacyl peptidase
MRSNSPANRPGNIGTRSRTCEKRGAGSLNVKKNRALRFAALTAVLIAGTGIAEEMKSVPTSGAKPGESRDEKKFETVAPMLPGAAEPVSAQTGTEKQQVEPLSLRPLTKIEKERNDSNPQWSPLGTLIAFERSIGDKKEIRIMTADGTEVQTVYFQLSEDGAADTKFFFPGVYEEVSYNAGITWSPGGDRFVFMSNGGEGNYDLYQQEIGGKGAARLTEHKEKDGQAHWSPAGNSIVFVSGRTGNGDVYLLNLATRALTRLTQGGKAYLYPRWSPDGKRIVMMHGSNENHHIEMITDPARPGESLKRLTAWASDDLRPVWSPDGRKIAFYSNYNTTGDPKAWSLIVVAADGSDPAEGEGLAAKVVASDVIPDVESGPAWLPDSKRIVYVKDDRVEYNPLYVVDVSQKTSLPIKTDTKMNHDVTCSADGVVAFRALVNQWDQIFLMRLKN